MGNFKETIRLFRVQVLDTRLPISSVSDHTRPHRRAYALRQAELRARLHSTLAPRPWRRAGPPEPTYAPWPRAPPALHAGVHAPEQVLRCNEKLTHVRGSYCTEPTCLRVNFYHWKEKGETHFIYFILLILIIYFLVKPIYKSNTLKVCKFKS